MVLNLKALITLGSEFKEKQECEYSDPRSDSDNSFHVEASVFGKIQLNMNRLKRLCNSDP